MELFNRIKFWQSQDRIGPDIPLTHWKLHFKSSMRRLCKKKFGYFHDTAEFRPGAYAVNCKQIKLGRRVVIRPACMLFADVNTGIVIEDDVMLGANVHIYVNNHKFEDPDIPLIDQGYCPAKSVFLKKGCWIGANVTILPGVTIGENTVIGAGSIVTKGIPDRVVAVGNPARVIREIRKIAG